MDTQKRVLFVGGTGRSGTTILKRILSLHPQITSLRDELRIITDPDGALSLEDALTQNWSPYNGDIAIQRFRRLVMDCCRGRSNYAVMVEKAEKNLFRRLGVSPRRYLGLGFASQFGRKKVIQALDQLTNEISFHRSRGSWLGSQSFQLPAFIYETEPLEPSTVRIKIGNFFETLYAGLPQAEEATIWLDDTPSNVLHVDRLLQLFPDMRFIHIYRDPRDVLSSYLKFAWGGDNVEATAKRLVTILNRWEQIKLRLPSDTFMEISLEQLGQGSRSVLEQLCAFLEIKYNQKLEEITLDKMNVGRWRNDLTIEQQQIATQYLCEFVGADS